MSKVSVIVPVYNVEEYLDKCLSSLVNQTLKDIEIIVVNDGSKDNSQKIIDKYAKKYKCIKAYKKENGGVSSARNFGIKKATGEYIGFVDSDDWVEPDMYEKMYNKAVSKDFDIVLCDAKEIYNNHTKSIKITLKNDINSKNELKPLLTKIYPVLWNKIYKNKIMNLIQFKKKVWYEDVEYLYRLFPYINNVGMVDEEFYNYLQREGSIVKTIDKRLYDYIDNWNTIIEFYKKNNFYKEYKKELEFCYVRYLYATFIKRACFFDQKDFDIAVEAAIKNVEKTFPKYKKNTYFYKSFKGIYLLIFNKHIANILRKIIRRKAK